MFWKHRKFRLVLFCFLSAILLTIPYIDYIAESLIPMETGPVYPIATTFPITMPTYERNTDSTHPQNIPQVGTMPAEYWDFDKATSTNTEPGRVMEVQHVKKRSLEPFFHALCILSGLVFAGIYCLSRQHKPFFGPEGDGFGCVLSLRILKYWTYFYPSIQIKVLTVLLIMLLLTCIRGLLWWLLNKISLSWGLTERAALYVRKTAGNLGYLTVHLLVCILLSICAVLVLTKILSILELLPFAVSIILCMLSICRFAKQTDHLQQQIDNLYQGREIATSAGVFTREEAQLSGLQARIDEAVTTAVTGERFKVELISNVSHDLRTPLTAILGYGELLEKETLSEEGQVQLKKLNQKAGYMRELVDSVFELTKISSGSVPPTMENIDLIRLLEQTLGLFDDELNGAGLQIRRHYCAESLHLMTDGNRLHQVFANLVGNAIKYALPGSRVHLHVTEDTDCITVRMTNIAAYEMDFQPEEVLQRFVRGDKARTSKGSGIGLAIAQTYTQSVGGSFRVEIDGEQFSAIALLPKTEREM